MKTKVVILIVSLGALVYGQEFRASLSGRVADPSGAGIADAKIEVVSVDTRLVSSVVSAEDGSYQVPFLNPGMYTIIVEKTGFHRLVREGVNLEVSEKAVVNVQLTLGEVSQSINVRADAALVETESADRGLTIENNRVENTPLSGRSIYGQAWAAPGVAVTTNVQRLRPWATAGNTGIAISGGQPGGNEVLIDGVSNLYTASNVAFVPPVEGTGEFRVQTTSYDAQYGWTTGGVVNIVTKGGGNHFHGSAFEFLQNTDLNANSFDNNLHGLPVDWLRVNIFGGAISGPVKKDKLFFLFTYENMRFVLPDPFVTSVPTPRQRSGDFSQTYYAAGTLQTIYDPYSTQTGPNGNLIRDAFPGNVIPVSRINPIAAKVLGIIPVGNVAGDPTSGLNNLISNGSSRKFTDFFPEYDGRADYNISEKTQMFVRYSRNALSENRSFHYSTTAATNIAETSTNAPLTRENHSATLQLTHIFSPSLVLNLRAGLLRYLALGGSSISQGYNLANLGFSPQFVSEAAAYFPKFNWANFEGAGSNPSTIDPVAQTNSLQGSVALVKGHHNIKTGLEFRLQRANRQNAGYTVGNFSFDQGFTGQNPLTIQPGSGNSSASFLLGTPSTGYVSVNSRPALQQRLWSTYIQDDISVTSKFKLNVGLRWDYLGPLTDRFNALLRGFDMTSPSPLQTPGLKLQGGPLFAGVGGSQGIFKSDWNNFGPRIGAAYQISPKTVLRGGYGLVYAQTFDDPGPAPGFSQQTQMVTSIQTGVPFNTLTNPFPNGILRPVGNSLGLATYLGQGFSVPNPDRVVPWTHQFSFEIQRALPGELLVSAAYIGSRTRNLEVSKGINEIPLSAFALGATTLTQNVSNPLAGLIPGTSLNGATVPRQQLLRPFPQFASITELDLSQGKSEYDSFQLVLYKRLSAGLNFSAAYTNSKTIEQVVYANPQDTRLLKEVAAWDIPQSLQLNGVYSLPFGKGKPFGGSVNPWLSRFISGWTISGIARIQEGMPMSFPTGAAPTGVSPTISNRTLFRWFDTCTLLASGATRGCLQGEQPVWTIQQPFTLRTWPLRLASVRNPPIYNLDASLLKNNYIREHFNLIIRADFLNATNTPQFFSGPITDVNNPNFGRISGAQVQSNLPRIIQLSMRFEF